MNLSSQPSPRWASGAVLGVLFLGSTQGLANDDLAETLLAKAIRAQEQQSLAEAEAELEAASQEANDQGLKALIERQRGLVALAKVEPTLALKFFIAAHTLDATIRLDPARHAQDAVDLFACARVLHEAGTNPTGAVTRGVDGHWTCPAPVPVEEPKSTLQLATPAALPNLIVREPTPSEEEKIPLMTWLGGGAAVAFAGTGIALGAAAMGQATDASTDSDGKGLAVGANIAFAVAGCAAITAVVAWMIE